MKAQVKDKIWARLSELAPRDVDGAASARIRERALAALCRRPPSSTEVIARRVERIWTDFVELPMVGGVIVAWLFWLMQGMTWGRFENSESLADRAREDASSTSAAMGWAVNWNSRPAPANCDISGKCASPRDNYGRQCCPAGGTVIAHDSRVADSCARCALLRRSPSFLAVEARRDTTRRHRRRFSCVISGSRAECGSSARRIIRRLW
jgi:hypothetical protein